MNAEARVDDSCRGGASGCGATAWEQAHVALKTFVRKRGAAEYEEGVLILAAFRCRVHLMLGLASFTEYLERHAGYSGRAGAERLRVAEALEALPVLASALRDGTLSWCAVRELTRVAVPSTEEAWVADARGQSVRFVEQRVAGLSPGDLPGTVPPPGARRYVLRFEVNADTMAMFREAQARVRLDSGGGLDDDGVMLAIARFVLGGPRDDGRASYQIAVMACPSCKQARMIGGGEAVEIDAPVRAMIECDAQVVPIEGRPEALNGQDEASSKGSMAVLQLEGSAHALRREDERASVDARGLEGAPVSGDAGDGPKAARERDARVDGRGDAGDPGENEGVPADRSVPGGGGDRSTAPREGRAAHVGHTGERRHRATQTIPPAIRRHVLLRDGKRCVVPGCRSSLYLDIHHLTLRSEGGGHEPERLITLCAPHHRAQHNGTLVIEGTPASGLVFRHADGTRYGQDPSPAVASAMHDAFLALVALGFREGESKRALAAVRARMPAIPTDANILKAALMGLEAEKRCSHTLTA